MGVQHRLCKIAISEFLSTHASSPHATAYTVFSITMVLDHPSDSKKVEYFTVNLRVPTRLV